MSAISGPVALYANVPINAQYYEPSRFVIEDISLGTTTTVTTTVDHNYVVGQTIRLLIPAEFGCFQLNGKQGYVISVPASDQVQVSIDSSKNVNQFISATSANDPQIIAIGDINSGQNNSNGTMSQVVFVPGSFINISPN